MKLIVGLGNPGPQYAKTRHNIGQRVVAGFAENSGIKFKRDKILRTQWAESHFNNDSFILAFPESFMNESGSVVRVLVGHFKINFQSDLLIVVDDVALPFGQLRLRSSGEDGGHRGLRSIEQALQSPSYARLRIGIAPEKPLQIPLEEFVLEPFLKEEEKRLISVIERSIEASRLWGSESFEKAMNLINKPSLN